MFDDAENFYRHSLCHKYPVAWEENELTMTKLCVCVCVDVQKTVKIIWRRKDFMAILSGISKTIKSFHWIWKVWNFLEKFHSWSFKYFQSRKCLTNSFTRIELQKKIEKKKILKNNDNRFFYNFILYFTLIALSNGKSCTRWIVWKQEMDVFRFNDFIEK